MITITKQAAEQIKKSQQGDNSGMKLRIAALRKVNGDIHYAMGFDDTEREKDSSYQCEGIEIVVAIESSELLKDVTIDYVELEPGDFQFIFSNPQDQQHSFSTAD